MVGQLHEMLIHKVLFSSKIRTFKHMAIINDLIYNII